MALLGSGLSALQSPCRKPKETACKAAPSQGGAVGRKVERAESETLPGSREGGTFCPDPWAWCGYVAGTEAAS